MKVGWQLKEEVPLFIILLVVVSALMYYMGAGAYTPMVSFGTGFLVAAIVTSLEVIVHAIQNKGRATPAPTKITKPKPRKTVKKKATKKKAAKKGKKRK